MRCLLDENVARRLTAVLTELGHPASHVIDLGLAASMDEYLLELAAEFDVFITFDQFLQPTVWHTARTAMLSGVRIVRLRETATERLGAEAQIRRLRRCWPLIEQRMGPDSDVRLAVISQGGELLRFRNVSPIRAMGGPEAQ